jgi:glycerophosphoryl diester phosphodiesterase
MRFLQTVVIAHRGASRVERENTVDAFRAAGRLGADWVELDVHRTADGALAVHHDAHLADGRALLELEAGELPEWLPLLDDALDACAPLGVNIEIKNSPQDTDFDPQVAVAAPVVEASLRVSGRGQQILVSSFHAPTLDRVRAIGSGVATAQLTFELPDATRAIEWAVAAGHAALHPWDATVTADLVARTHAAGLAVNVWTVDDPARMTELAGFGVDGIVTNVPDVAARALGRAH